MMEGIHGEGRGGEGGDGVRGGGGGAEEHFLESVTRVKERKKENQAGEALSGFRSRCLQQLAGEAIKTSLQNHNLATRPRFIFIQIKRAYWLKFVT